LKIGTTEQTFSWQLSPSSNITKPGLDRIVGGKLMVEIDLKLDDYLK